MRVTFDKLFTGKILAEQNSESIFPRIPQLAISGVRSNEIFNAPDFSDGRKKNTRGVKN